MEDHFIASHSIIETKKEEGDLKFNCDLLDILESEDLPEGWQELVDNNGQKFYLDHKTNKSQWEDPRISLMN